MSLEPTTIQESVEVVKAVGPIEAFGLNGKIFAAQLVNFLFVLLVLWRFAYRPIVQMLEVREEKIKKSVEAAEEMTRQAAVSQKEREELLAETRLEATRVIAEAQEKAEEKGAEVLAKTKKEAEKVVFAARAHISEEREKMLAEVRGEIASLVVLATEKVLGESTDKKRAEKATEEALAKAGL